MKDKHPVSAFSAPHLQSPSEQHVRDERLRQETADSIMTRLEGFAQDFERLAETAAQGVQAERFKAAVLDFAKGGQVDAADLTYRDFPAWLKGQADRFQELAATAAQKELASSFQEFAREMGSQALKEVFQKPLVHELVEDIKDWMGGTRNGEPFASLSRDGKLELLEIGVDWTDYINRGLDLGGDTAGNIRRIVDNAIAGKPPEQWFEAPASYQQMLTEAASRAPAEQDKDRSPER